MFLLIYASLTADEFSINEAYCSIPEKDRYELELFFKDLVSSNQFGYTIFSDKPVSIRAYFPSIPFGNLFRSNGVDFTKTRWKTWEKYQHLFYTPNYVFTNKDNVIVLINIKSLKNFFHENSSLIKKKLGENVSANSLIDALTNSEKKGLFEVINHDEEIYGQLLGYGKKSSGAFRRFFELERYINPLYHHSFSLKWVVPSKGFESISEEYCFLLNQFITPPPDHILHIIQPVTFMAIRDDAETQKLIRKYTKDKKNLSRVYRNQSYFLTSIEKLCQP